MHVWRVCVSVCECETMYCFITLLCTPISYFMFFLYIGKTSCLTGYANKQFEFEFEFVILHLLSWELS